MLPTQIDAASFDALQAQPEAWLPVVRQLADAHGGGQLQPAGAGSVLVALLGSDRVLKLYPPFLHDHFAFERAMLPLLAGRLAVPTPALLADGEHQGWPYLLMGRLAGTAMTTAWPTLAEADKNTLLQAIGALAAQVHALPVPETLRPLAPDWPDFIARQRAGCAARQQRTGLPAHLLAQLEAFIAGPLPGETAQEEKSGRTVLLTGEYTPMNLLVDGPRLVGMYDFGDGLLGPREYDWLGPLCFLAAGQPARCAALRQGLGLTGDWDAEQRQRLLRLLLLHRYSCLPAQIKRAGWEQAPGFAVLADWLWGG